MTKTPTRKGGGKGTARQADRPTAQVSPPTAATSVGQPPTQSGNKRASRRVTYSRAFADRVCADVIDGLTLRQVAAKHGVHKGTICRWLAAHPEFSAAWRAAVDIRCHQWAEETIDIADDGSNDWIEVERHNKKGEVIGTSLVFNTEAVQRSRLRVDTRKWHLTHLMAKVYGEKVAVEASGPGGGPLVHEHHAPVATAAFDAFVAKLAAITGDGPGE